jgi:hypothetical protein
MRAHEGSNANTFSIPFGYILPLVEFTSKALRALVNLSKLTKTNTCVLVFAFCGQETWLSELYREREYIKSSIQMLQELIV